MGERLGLEGLPRQDRRGLLLQLRHALGTRARARLVARHDDAVDVAELAQGLKRHDHLDGGTVGVCDDAGVPGNVGRVDLGHHERHVGFHTEGARVVDHDGTGGHHSLAHLARDGGTGAEQGDVDALEAAGSHLLHRNLTAAEGQLLTGRASRGKGAHLATGKVEGLQAREHLAAHGSRGTGDGHDGVCGHRLGPCHVNAPPSRFLRGHLRPCRTRCEAPARPWRTGRRR